jgi:hypothetical protein
MDFMSFQSIGQNSILQAIVARLRRRRLEILQSILSDLRGSVTILDIGGTPAYWDLIATERLNLNLHIILLNLVALPISNPSFASIVGDGRAMPQFSDKQFDIVFSNSTIEHVGDLHDQERMAREIRRIGRRYYVQTPNRSFPIEPHFIFPFFQYLPIRVQAWLVLHLRLGWYGTPPGYNQVLNDVKSIRLLNRAEFRQLFPDATIVNEVWCGLVKSFIAYSSG